MESSESDEPEKKRPHLTSPLSLSMARNSSTSPPSNKSVDVAVLQLHNQKLFQQLDIQKHELHDLETKIQESKERQIAYDNMLITINQLWNQLVDDLVLLGVRAGGGDKALPILNHSDYSRGSIPSCPAGDIFLCRLLGTDSIECCGNNETVRYVEEALASRHSSTMKLMKILEDAIDAQRLQTESIAQALLGKLSAEDSIFHLSRIDDMMKEEVKHLQEAINVLHLKHKEYTDEIQTYMSCQSVDQSEIRCLAGELEESMAELEESRRKLVNLKMQKDAAAGLHTIAPSAINGSLSPEKPAERSKGLRQLKDAIEEAKILVADRLSELQDAQDENHILSKELEDLQDELKDDKYILSSRLYSLVNDQLQHWKAEAERYKAMKDSLQADRPLVVRREKEVNAKVESTDAARNSIDSTESRIEELEHKLQKCIIEKNDLALKMEEAIEDLGRKDIKTEFRVMATALSKEMGMMEAQMNRWKETACEALSLRQQSESLRVSLSEKTNEQKCLSKKCDEQILEMKSLKVLIEKLQKEKLELQIILDMYGQEGYDRRDVWEITEAIKSKDKEAESYISEIETIGQAYEDMQTQNQHLLQQVADRDDYNIKLVSESVKTKQAQSSLLSEKQALSKQLQQVNTSVEYLKTRVSQYEEQMKACMEEAIRSTEEDRHFSVNLDTARWELMDADKELKWLKYAVASSEKEHEQIQKKMDEILSELQNERTERKKLDEELMELNDKIAEMTSESGEATIQRIQNEIKECKSMLKCSVCSDRPKEVVIVKCYHLFCNPCIQRNLEIRHRKCPGCGTAFGQSDVRFVKI
ncbi:E3 ubiquitin-protein ligase BRE1-like 2 isoform X2 [Euphorbia lathyris]|uniref:E3 ubiquitin-protein ligase BRE1-like 2 isoform X2 n=1 Tax=Euphorbia lathyris TaxID=212925 RepID=UPI0033133E76